MLLPVDLMSIVSAGSPSTHRRDAGATDLSVSASWLLAADASALSESGNDMINKIFMSYANDGEADPTARFAHDLKALLSANGVSFTNNKAVLPSSNGMSALPPGGEPGELAWSADELLQMAIIPAPGGNNLPLDDQTLPSELSNWLTALITPATGNRTATELVSPSAGTPTAGLAGGVATTGATEPSQASPTTPLMTAVAGVVAALTPAQSTTAGRAAVVMPESLSIPAGTSLPSGRAQPQPAMAVTQAAGLLPGSAGFQPAAMQTKPAAITDQTVITVAAGSDAAVLGSVELQLTVAESQLPEASDRASSALDAAQGQIALPDTMLQASLAADVTRQATETTQLNPGGQKLATDAANASAFRPPQVNPAPLGDTRGHADDVLASQPDLTRASGPTERNQAIASQLTASLTAAVSADNPPSSNSSLNVAQSDPGALMNRPEPRMFSSDNAQQAQAQAAQQSLARAADSLPRFVMDTALGQQGWPDSLSRQLMVMSSQGVSSAQIQLDPPELGSLMVKIQVSADQQTNVSFVSQHAVVREALEQQLNRLQDLFREQGLNLQDVSVSDQSPQQREGESGEQQGQSRDSGANDRDSANAEPEMMRSESLIDFYA